MRVAAADDPIGVRAFALVLETGEEVADALIRFVDDQQMMGARFTAIGALERARLQYWDWDAKAYDDIPIDEQVEVASLIGNLARLEDGAWKMHAHAVLGRRGGAVLAGHLDSGIVRPTLEVFLVESNHPLRRREDPVTRLSLLRP